MDAGPIVEVLPPVVEQAKRGVPGFFQIDNLLAYENGLLIVAAWFLTELLSRVTKGVTFVARLLPLVPTVICVALVFLTTEWQPEATDGERVILGVLLGMMTVNGHVLAKRWGLHDFLPFMRAKPEQDAEEDAPPS